jgi:hypothetical protein
MARGERVAGDGGTAERRNALNPLALLATLREHNVEFVIIGGFSVAVHGVIRATKDIDIVPEPSSANLARLAAALRQTARRARRGSSVGGGSRQTRESFAATRRPGGARSPEPAVVDR